MKKLVFCFFLCTILFNGVAQTDSKVVAGTIETISSKILNEDLKVWVYVPNSEASDVSSPSKYPVVYLLDGDTHFLSVTGMLQELSSFSGNMISPEMIVVGIISNNRSRDLTPTHAEAQPPFADSRLAAVSGGGEKFISFIEKELIPYIDSKYPTQPYRMLMGHSLGGLTVMNTLINHTDLFNSYVAIDPSMWWDNKKLLLQAEKVLSDKSFEGKSLYLAMANTMPHGMNLEMAKKDMTPLTAQIHCVFKLDTLLRQNASNKLRYSSKFYNDETHSSIPMIAGYDALHFLFDFYALNLTPQDFMSFSAATLQKIEDHYGVISKNMGYTVKCPEMMANGLGYALMRQRRFKESELVFSMNVRNYPSSFDAYNSMGDLYDATGEKAKAIDSYKKALSIKEFPDTRVKLDALLKK
jgi:Predicted hydrolase of the alpha/beta superfamily